MDLESTVALKEWAVAVKALNSGKQIMLMRKGGITEETRDFQLKSNTFYLFPTYEHQKKALIKPEFQDELEETLQNWDPLKSTVSISSFAQVEEDIELFDPQQLKQLQPFHIWMDHFAEDRLKWKRKNPLHILLLRVYNLNKPLEVPILPSYLGCKSWIQVETKLPKVKYTPVLKDQEFNMTVQKIKNVL